LRKVACALRKNGASAGGPAMLGPARRIGKDLQGFARICKDLQGFPAICMDFWGFARICNGLQGFLRICKDLQADGEERDHSPPPDRTESLARILRGFWRRFFDLFRFRKDLHGFGTNSKDLHGFAKIYMDLHLKDLQRLQRFGRIWKDLQGSAKVCKDLHGFEKFEKGKLVFEVGSCHYTKLTVLGLYVALRGPNVPPGLPGVYVALCGPSMPPP
jgi:hypothetical protein